MSTSISIGQLVKEVANSNANDLEVQTDLLGKLYEIKVASRDLPNPELGFMLDAAADLMRYLADGLQPTAEALLTMVTRLIVNAECSMYRCMELTVEQPLEQPVQAGLPPAIATNAPPPLPSNCRSLSLPPSVSSDKAVKTSTLSLCEQSKPESTDLNEMKLGQVLVQLGLVNPEQLSQALDHQRDTKVRLGEALASLGHVVPHELQHALGLQSKMREFADSQPPTDGYSTKPKIEMDAWQESLLGAILVADRAITEQELKKGLSIQRATGMRLGEALVHHGLSDWKAVRAGIQAQERLRHEAKPKAGLRMTLGGIEKKRA